MCYWICLALVLVPLLWEYSRLKRWRSSIPFRIHVHGTRGKSGITRGIASFLRFRGYKVLAKTTGDAPEYIFPDGSVHPIKRLAPARIQEHVNIMRMAATMKVNVVVVEGMALQPETIYQSEKILQATHAVITNLRPDHAETMGNAGRKGVLRALRLMIPDNGILYTAREAGALKLRTYAKASGTSCIVVPTASLLDQQQELILTVSEAVSQKKDQSIPDMLPLSTPAKIISAAGIPVIFHDLFSANDVISSRLLWKSHEQNSDHDCLRVAMLATRADRPLRTKAFVDWLVNDHSFDQLALIGDHACYAYLRAVRNSKEVRGRLIFCPNPWLRPENFMKKLHNKVIVTGKEKMLLVGLGNSHGFAERWRSFISRMEMNDAP